MHITLLSFICFIALTPQQSAGVKDMELLISREWNFENSTPLNANDKDAGGLSFNLKDHTFTFSNNPAPTDVVAAANKNGKWKITSSDDVEYFLILKKDTFKMELGYDMHAGKRTLLITQKSKRMEDASYINLYYEK